MNPETKKYIAFFDLDRTILSINSGSVLVREAYKHNIMSAPEFLHAIYFSFLYKFHLRDTDLIIAGMGKWLKGIPLETVEKLSQNILNKHFIQAIRPEIISEISLHKGNGAEVVILSSAIEEICQPISGLLNFDNFICSKMNVADGFYTGFPENKFCFEVEKKRQLLDYCKRKNYNLAEAYYYGDSIDDLPALEAVGHPVCVVPDKKLRSVALKKGWAICNW